jgi:ABC-type dipeptide/oligopeptide/nickel transport system permease subunit
MTKTPGGSVVTAPKQARPWYSVLYIQVLIAITIGVLVGYFYPKTGTALKPLGDAFIALIRMMIAPVIFCTVVHGIASMERPGQGQSGWPEGASVFRSCLHGRARHRIARR